MKLLNFIFTVTTFSLSSINAEILSFPTVWNTINAESAAQDSARLQTQSLRESQERAQRHWFPKVYIDAKTYHTNDPGASFFGLLEQRSLVQSDFNPSFINRPDSQLYTRGSLGVDLALYEGGMKQSQVEFFKHSVAAQKSATSQAQLEQFSVVGQAYASIAVLEQQKERLQTLSSEVSRSIKGYQLGSKSNPVGYSGLLGMKSLLNRLKGLVSHYESQSRSYYATLKELGIKNQIWSPEKINALAFIQRYLHSPNQKNGWDLSYRIESAKENVKALDEITTMEKARFLPHIGAFAETYAFSGDRNTADGYNAGIYLRWNIFDPSTHGSVKETKLKSMAAEKYSVASEQQERAEQASLDEALKSLYQNIELLNESHQLLTEQSKTMETLFKNGSINAIQMVEVQNHRADLIVQQGDVELGLVKVSSQMVTKQKFDIEAHINSSGEKNEK